MSDSQLNFSGRKHLPRLNEEILACLTFDAEATTEKIRSSEDFWGSLSVPSLYTIAEKNELRLLSIVCAICGVKLDDSYDVSAVEDIKLETLTACEFIISRFSLFEKIIAKDLISSELPATANSYSIVSDRLSKLIKLSQVLPRCSLSRQAQQAAWQSWRAISPISDETRMFDMAESVAMILSRTGYTQFVTEIWFPEMTAIFLNIKSAQSCEVDRSSLNSTSSDKVNSFIISTASLMRHLFFVRQSLASSLILMMLNRISSFFCLHFEHSDKSPSFKLLGSDAPVHLLNHLLFQTSYQNNFCSTANNNNNEKDKLCDTSQQQYHICVSSVIAKIISSVNHKDNIFEHPLLCLSLVDSFFCLCPKEDTHAALVFKELLSAALEIWPNDSSSDLTRISSALFLCRLFFHLKNNTLAHSRSCYGFLIVKQSTMFNHIFYALGKPPGILRTCSIALAQTYLASLRSSVSSLAVSESCNLSSDDGGDLTSLPELNVPVKWTEELIQLNSFARVLSGADLGRILTSTGAELVGTELVQRVLGVSANEKPNLEPLFRDCNILTVGLDLILIESENLGDKDYRISEDINNIEEPVESNEEQIQMADNQTENRETRLQDCLPETTETASVISVICESDPVQNDDDTDDEDDQYFKSLKPLPSLTSIGTTFRKEDIKERFGPLLPANTLTECCRRLTGPPSDASEINIFSASQGLQASVFGYGTVTEEPMEQQWREQATLGAHLPSVLKKLLLTSLLPVLDPSSKLNDKLWMPKWNSFITLSRELSSGFIVNLFRILVSKSTEYPSSMSLGADFFILAACTSLVNCRCIRDPKMRLWYFKNSGNIGQPNLLEEQRQVWSWLRILMFNYSSDPKLLIECSCWMNMIHTAAIRFDTYDPESELSESQFKWLKRSSLDISPTVTLSIASSIKSLSVQNNFSTNQTVSERKQNNSRGDVTTMVGFDDPALPGPAEMLGKQNASSQFMTVLSLWLGLTGPNMTNLMDVMTQSVAVLKFYSSPWFKSEETQLPSKDASPEIRLACHLLTCSISHILSSSRISSQKSESLKIKYIHDCLMDVKDFRW